MHTPITVFEAWLGMTIAEYHTNEFKPSIEDIEYKFNWLTVDTDQLGEDGCYITDLDVSSDKNVKELLEAVEGLYSNMKQALEGRCQEKLEELESYEDVFKEFFQFGKKYRIGMQLCEYHDTQQELNENHFQMAKNDKANFETLILNFNK